MEELQLDFQDAMATLDEDELFVLPQLLFTNSSFRELHFSCCNVVPKAGVGWNSLKKLSIDNVRLSEDVIQDILAGTPVLEILGLGYFYGFSRLHIRNGSLKSLILTGFWEEIDREDGFPFEISAPNLMSLEISGCVRTNKCCLADVSSMVDATLNCYYDSSEEVDHDCQRQQNILGGLLEGLVHVKNLTLGAWAIQVLSIMKTNGLRSPLSECKCLTIGACIKKSVLPGISSLLESCSHLETLVITMPEYDNTENARVLQKMVIETQTTDPGSIGQKEVLQAALRLLSFPRSSPDALVTFCGAFE